MKKVLSNKNFILLFQGAFVSEIGNMLYNTAMMFFVLELTGSALQMTVFMAISVLIRVILSPVAGVLVDRWNRVRIIYMTDFIRGALFLVLWYLVYTGLDGNNTIFILYIVTALSSANAALFFPAASSSVPDIVGEANLQAAQGVQGFLMNIPQIIGVAFGAALYDLMSIDALILINAITFVLSGISEMFIKTPYKKELSEIEIETEPRSMMADYKDSLVYIKKIGLLNMVIFFLFINFAVTPLFSAGTPALFKQILARENTLEFAYTSMMFSFAAMIGSIVIGSIKFKSYRRAIPMGVFRLFVLFALNALLFHLVATGVIPYWTFYWIYMALIAILGFNLAAVNLPIHVGMTLSIEPNMRGRVFSTVGALSQLAIPFAMIMGGLFIDYLSISLLGLVCSVLLFIPTIGFMVNGKVRQLFNNLDEKAALLETEQQELELQEA